MALKSFRPLTPALRFKSLPAFTEITKAKPHKSLVEVKKRSGGRNNNGRLTSRHIGGGHTQKYRKVDFKRRKYGVAAEVTAIEYDPNRSARIALIKYADGEMSYILAPDGLTVGAKVMSGNEAPPDLGNSLPLSIIPLGANIHNIEIAPGRGGQIARSAGQQATLSNREAGYALAFFDAPRDADQGLIQKIFYLHVPLAIVSLCGFMAGGIMALLREVLRIGEMA
jgi:large subunit ribosomal protein L2